MGEEYGADSIKVLEGLEGVRKRPELIGISNEIKKQGDIITLTKKFKIKPRALYALNEEQRILSIFPNLEKSKVNALSRLKTDRELFLFSKINDVYNISYKKLYKLVQSWNKDIQQDPLVILRKDEHDILIGMILGGASIRMRDKNSCLRITHSLKQEDYLKSIKNIFIDFYISEFCYKERSIKNHMISVINYATKTHPVFNYYYNLFYKNGRKSITLEVLNNLSPLSLAYWICDDGSYCNKQKYYILCTNSYTLKEHELIKEFFNKKFGLDPKISYRDKKYYYLRFNKKDSTKLKEIIRSYIPESMKYKLGEKENA